MLYGLSSRSFGSKSFPMCIKPFILKKYPSISNALALSDDH